jgi:sugar transferase (PEP-CTERM/EpsH1 system associated)
MLGTVNPAQSPTEPSEITKKPPLIVHVIHYLGVGGLENGLVNLINHIPSERYRHAIVCLKGYSDFSKRITRKNVKIVALNKREGLDFSLYVNLFKTLKELKPDIVHTRNLATIEGQVIATAARIRTRIHGEHGRDVFDLHGKNLKYNLLRRTIRPVIDHFIAVSKDLENWLINTIGVIPNRIDQIYNGVDSYTFYPRNKRPGNNIGPEGFFTEDSFVIGSVGRMAAVKDYPNLVRVFLKLLKEEAALQNRLRLLIVGEGGSRRECIEMLREAGAEAKAWFPGERADIPELLRTMDLFVLPSLGEGISNTILEAMSTGLPVVATSVGGNIELVKDECTGKLVPSGVPETMAEAISTYYRNPNLLDSHGKSARKLIESRFSMEAMTNSYLKVYDKALRSKIVT